MVRPLFWVEVQMEKYSRSRVGIMKKSRSQFKEQRLHSYATNVEINLPVPSDTTSPNIRASMGTATYTLEEDAILWKIRSFPGNKVRPMLANSCSREYLLRAEFRLPSITADGAPERKAPISVKFDIPYFTVSGIQVRHLKVIEKSGYMALPWVRYITRAGQYEIRLF
ncbi:hypothetical protein Droror1_Dr00004452 [Drosera rotundifolia]